MGFVNNTFDGFQGLRYYGGNSYGGLGYDPNAHVNGGGPRLAGGDPRNLIHMMSYPGGLGFNNYSNYYGGGGGGGILSYIVGSLFNPVTIGVGLLSYFWGRNNGQEAAAREVAY